MTLSKNAELETGISLAIPEISAEVSLLIPTHPDLYRVIPESLREGHRSPTSRDITLQESYPCISGYPGISRDMAGYRFSRCSG